MLGCISTQECFVILLLIQEAGQGQSRVVGKVTPARQPAKCCLTNLVPSQPANCLPQPANRHLTNLVPSHPANCVPQPANCRLTNLASSEPTNCVPQPSAVYLHKILHHSHSASVRNIRVNQRLSLSSMSVLEVS